jgi:hypothetical protein
VPPTERVNVAGVRLDWFVVGVASVGYVVNRIPTFYTKITRHSFAKKVEIIHFPLKVWVRFHFFLLSSMRGADAPRRKVSGGGAVCRTDVASGGW